MLACGILRVIHCERAARVDHAPLKLTKIIGHASDPELAAELHRLEHAGRVERVRLGAGDLSRRRLRLTSDRGTPCAIALPRSESLVHGAVLALSQERAILVELEELRWLAMEPRDLASALRLGFVAGHHHWRVRFDGRVMRVALEEAAQHYLDRVHEYLGPGMVSQVGPEEDGTR